MARPRIEINWTEFDKLCALQCTLNEIASWFGCSPDTIERAVKRDKKRSFADYYEEKRGTGRIALRRYQMQAAEKGNTAMLIWLGKQYLGQTDKQETQVDGGLTIRVVYADFDAGTSEASSGPEAGSS